MDISDLTKLTNKDNVNDLKNIPGGEEEYGNMMQWAGKNLEKGEIEMFDAIMDRGDPLAAFFAVQAPSAHGWFAKTSR